MTRNRPTGDRGRAWRSPALLAGLLILAAPAQAQTPDSTEPGAGGGRIESEQLAPLTPQGQQPPQREGEAREEGIVPRESRFKVAPYRGVSSPLAPELIEPIPTEARSGARLRQLDKMTGLTKTVEIAAGEEAMIDRLRVRLETCRAPEDGSQHGMMAFLQVWDTKRPAAEPAFSGWMFAESPALSALDHPRYDLWVISCTTSEGATAKASE